LKYSGNWTYVAAEATAVVTPAIARSTFSSVFEPDASWTAATRTVLVAMNLPHHSMFADSLTHHETIERLDYSSK
jgi:hypothetical protein